MTLLDRALCGMVGHAWLWPVSVGGRLFVRCEKCGRETSGVQVLHTKPHPCDMEELDEQPEEP